MQIKMTKRYHLIPGRMVIIKKPKAVGVGLDVEKLKPGHTVIRNSSWCKLCGKQCSGSSKN